MAEAHDERLLASYEGLVFSTARRYSPYVQEEFEDICQLLRVKVFKALLAYDPTKVRSIRPDGRHPRDTYVFGAVKNGAKDLLKKRWREECFLEDVAPAIAGDGDRPRLVSRDKYELENGMSTTHEQVYGAIEDDDVLVPNTLTELERVIVVYLYRDYRQSEVARRLELPKKDMECLMRSIRDKLADWKPEAEVLVFVSDRPALIAA